MLIVFPVRVSGGLPLLSWVCRAGHNDLLAGVVRANRKLHRRLTLIDDNGLVAVRMAGARNNTGLGSRGTVWLG